MITGALIFLVETAAGLFAVALLLRFYLQWLRAAHRNPVSDFVNALTDFIVKPARRVIPGLWGLDLATLLLAWLVQVVEIVIVLLLKGYNPFAGDPSGLVALALLAVVLLIKTMVYILIFALIVQAVMSWVNPYTPLAPLLGRMVRPAVAPFQRFIRPVGNVDLTPLVAIIVLQLVLMVPIAYLEAALGRAV